MGCRLLGNLVLYAISFRLCFPHQLPVVVGRGLFPSPPPQHHYLPPHCGQASYVCLTQFTTVAAQLVVNLKRMVGSPQGSGSEGLGQESHWEDGVWASVRMNDLGLDQRGKGDFCRGRTRAGARVVPL